MVVTEYALERQGEQEVLHIFCHSEHEVAMCPRCGQFSDVLHEQEERCIRHLDIWGKPPTCIFHPAVLTANIARNHSRKACPGVESKRRESTAYELHVYEQCQHMDQAAVAERGKVALRNREGHFFNADQTSRKTATVYAGALSGCG